MRYLYSALVYSLLPLLLLRMLWRSRLAPGYRQRLLERFGLFAPRPTLNQPAIWVHAVSLGETLAAAPLVEALLRDWPGYPVVLTTTTPTGSDRVRALFGNRVFHVYAPWDVPGAVRRFLRRTRPTLLVLLETELWPNMLHYSRASGCRVLLANARLSAPSARGYARVASLTRQMLARLDTVACQSETDGQRFLALGLAASALRVTGSIKFDLEPGGEVRARAMALRDRLGAAQRPVLVAASTHPGEEALVLDAFSQVRRRFDNCLLVLVPRHPERSDQVYRLCARASWRVQRYSAAADFDTGTAVALVDTVGDLLPLLASATVAVIGGSFADHGGHNVLEAAAWGVPVVTGPFMGNFVAASELLTGAGAMLMLAEADQLGPTLLELLGDATRRQAMGAAGQAVVAANRGATERLLGLVGGYLAGH